MSDATHRMRWPVTTLVFCVSALLVLGLVMMYSAGMTRVGGQTQIAGPELLLKQLTWCVVGLVACVLAGSLDYGVLRRLAWPTYGLAVFMLTMVLVVGEPVKGARRWLEVGGFGFQPSEFAKLALIMTLAAHAHRHLRKVPTWQHGILIPGLIIGTVLGLIFVEPDRGTTILLAGVSAVLLVIAGVRWIHFLPPLLAGLVGMGFMLLRDPLRLKRIMAWVDMEAHKTDVGYQGYQAMIALGSGGWFGQGLGNGRQKLGFVPEHHTDFIFSIIGEELGLIATIGVVVAFALIVVCGVVIAMRAREPFGVLLGCGITFLIGFQAFINIGVVTSVLPNKGLSLPFISSGGSNLVLMMTCVGLLLSIARYGRASVASSPFTSPAVEPAAA
jgi:cell division protein FtsW